MDLETFSASPINANELVAHRGFRGKYPENTILSITKAIEAGALFVELDVQFSEDKLPIIYHDSELSRVSGEAMSVFQMSRASLLKISAYEPDRLGDKYADETIAPLEALVAVLVRNPAVIAFVEIKDESIAHCGREAMLETIETVLEPVAKQTVIMSFDYELCAMARASDWPLVGVVLEAWQDLESDRIQQIEPDFIYVDHEIIPKNYDLPASKFLANSTLVAYEVGNRSLGYALLARGVDMLETYEIEAMMASD